MTPRQMTPGGISRKTSNSLDTLLTFTDPGNGYTRWTTTAHAQAVPEPAAYAALAGLAAMVVYAVIRRRTTRG
ncbi:MAG: PEP-CTERM sorting domain-containing protein [Opitutaceae bacterium]|nr:PEP-CTERM sorting domain-containing protein [Opitutaceae bacterium]